MNCFQTPMIVGSSSTLTSLLLASSPQASSFGPSSALNKTNLLSHQPTAPNFLNLQPQTNVASQQATNSKTVLKPGPAAEKNVNSSLAVAKTVVNSSAMAKTVANSSVVAKTDVNSSKTVNSSPASKTANSSPAKSCEYCQIKVSQFLCAGCSNRSYCSRGCQEKDWDLHCDVCT